MAELHAKILALRKNEEECAKNLREETFQRTLLQGRVERLEAERASIPFMSLMANFSTLSDDIKDTLDALSDPLVVSSNRNGGQLLFVNQAFSDTLQYPREEILARGWRHFIDPSDLKDTQVAEAAAWDTQVRPVNRYMRKDGTLVTFRWYATAYMGPTPNAISFAVAKVVG